MSGRTLGMEEESISNHRKKEVGRVTFDYSMIPKINSQLFGF